MIKAIVLALAATSLASAIRLTAEAQDWNDDLRVVTTLADALGNQDGDISLDEIKDIYLWLEDQEKMKPEKIDEHTALWEDLYAFLPDYMTFEGIKAFMEALPRTNAP